MKQALAAILGSLALTLSALPAAADAALVERWYQALLAVDRDGLSEDGDCFREFSRGRMSHAELVQVVGAWRGRA